MGDWVNKNYRDWFLVLLFYLFFIMDLCAMFSLWVWTYWILKY